MYGQTFTFEVLYIHGFAVLKTYSARELERVGKVAYQDEVRYTLKTQKIQTFPLALIS